MVSQRHSITDSYIDNTVPARCVNLFLRVVLFSLSIMIIYRWPFGGFFASGAINSLLLVTMMVFFYFPQFAIWPILLLLVSIGKRRHLNEGDTNETSED